MSDLSHANLGQLFYKDYFRDLKYEWQFPNLTDKDREEIKSHNKELLEGTRETGNRKRNFSIYDRDYFYEDHIENIATNQSFQLTTTYPGLFSGSGYQHGVGAEGEFKIGFFFEHTSGLPVIPGSEVKGMLRSAFPKFGRDKNVLEEVKLNKAKHILWQLTKDDNLVTQPFNRESPEIKYLIELEKEIFDGEYNKTRIDVYHCDQFFDSVIIAGNQDNKLLGNDFITPHKYLKDRSKSYLDPFTNPTPLMFLKVLPGVSFEFRFRLFESQIEMPGSRVKLSAERKKDLFKDLLLTLGIGAKTNVGYGQFSESHTRRTNSGSSNVNPAPESEIPSGMGTFLKKNMEFNAIISDIGDKYATITFNAGNSLIKLVKPIDKIKFSIELKMSVKVKIMADYLNDGKPNFQVQQNA